MYIKDVYWNDVELPQWVDIIRRPAVYWLLLHKNKILVIRPAWDPKHYSLPWWALELWENINQGLIREFHEETGVNIQPYAQPMYLHDSFFKWPVSENYYHWICFYYQVKYISSEKEFLESEKETKEIKWLDLSEINLEEFTYFQRNFLMYILNKYEISK